MSLENPIELSTWQPKPTGDRKFDAVEAELHRAEERLGEFYFRCVKDGSRGPAPLDPNDPAVRAEIATLETKVIDLRTKRQALIYGSR
ncbi:hypothetical protein Rctr16k_22 [Virus Rctr16k]|nr:hypothetical protein Rctr16k_22 [Virus Rctr16k]